MYIIWDRVKIIGIYIINVKKLISKDEMERGKTGFLR